MKRHQVTGSGGVRLNVVEAGRGAGQSILFIHGWSQSHLSWMRQLQSPLADRFRLVALDIRGHGDSDKPIDGYGDASSWSDDIQAVIDTLAMERPLLVGWSYGGLIINDYVRQRGQKHIAGLCYASAATDLGVDTEYDFLGASWNGLLPTRQDSVVGTVFSDNAEEVATAMRMFVRGCFATPLPADEEAMILGFNLLCPSRVRAALFNRSLQNDDILSDLDIPVLVSHGDADEVVRFDTGRHIASKVKNARLSAYPNAGHALFWEEPERFNKELAEFATGLS